MTGSPFDDLGPAGRLPHDFPPVVYLPCLAEVTDAADARIVMRTTKDGRLALLAYSALDRLRNCCGPTQPWIVAPTIALSRLHAAEPFDLLLLDIMIPPERRALPNPITARF
ncbi:hypothetical protein O7627_21460 [Solwaraspora sp. WMMD1047]|uniref:SAV_915 family protein n=1 Tax=Solwaraspora sp. WMMD1047 TaxID=3016102 RepID=UPI002418057D|nr:SAV_915 family protein [Solwaraspora sp. WMMD1047]MDG4831852.1 hypothetical protein [Solwaraspora sp. WMMD1047]